MNIKPIAISAVAGLIAAIKTDVNAWEHSEPGLKFDWKLAFRRWAAGAFFGAVAGAGLGNLSF